MAAERRASVTWKGDLMSGSGTIDEVGSGAFGPLDVSWAARSEEASGGKTSPEELIAAAHASCFSMALSLGLAKGGTPPEQLRTSAVVTFVPGTGITKSALTVRGARAGPRRGRLPRGGGGGEEGLPGLPGAGRRPGDHARRRSRRVAAPAPRPVDRTLAQPGADRVRQHVLAGCAQVLVVANLPQREAVTPEVAGARVLRVELLGVDAVDAMERLREVIAQALDDEVVVVRHQAESVNVEAEAFDRLPQLGEEAAAVVAVEVDGAAFDTARRRVPDAVGGERRARQPWHAEKLEAKEAVQHPCGNIGTQL